MYAHHYAGRMISIPKPIAKNHNAFRNTKTVRF